MSFLDGVTGLLGNLYAGNEEKGLGNDLMGFASEYNPFIKYGKDSGADLSALVHSLLTDPEGYYSKVMDGFKMSPDQQTVLNKSLDDVQRTMENEAAITGGAGSTSSARNLQNSLYDTEAGMRNNMSQQYFSNVMKELGGGMSSAANLEQMGLGALGQKTNLQSQGAVEQRQGKIHKMSGIMNFAASLDPQAQMAQSMGGMSSLLGGLGSMGGSAGGVGAQQGGGAQAASGAAGSSGGGMSLSNILPIVGMLAAFL